jgi:calpain-15
LRNPWGHKEWLGDWSDNSDKWTEPLKKQLSVIVEDDGTFFISYTDYLNYYRATTICKYHDNYIFTAIKSKHMKGEKSMFKLTLKEETDIFITVSQKNIRMTARNENYEVSFVKIIVGLQTDDQRFPLKFINGKCF